LLRPSVHFPVGGVPGDAGCGVRLALYPADALAEEVNLHVEIQWEQGQLLRLEPHALLIEASLLAGVDRDGDGVDDAIQIGIAIAAGVGPDPAGRLRRAGSAVVLFERVAEAGRRRARQESAEGRVYASIARLGRGNYGLIDFQAGALPIIGDDR